MSVGLRKYTSSERERLSGVRVGGTGAVVSRAGLGAVRSANVGKRRKKACEPLGLAQRFSASAPVVGGPEQNSTKRRNVSSLCFIENFDEMTAVLVLSFSFSPNSRARSVNVLDVILLNFRRNDGLSLSLFFLLS